MRLCQPQTYSNATPTLAPAEVKYKVYSRRRLKRERRRRQCTFYDPLINKSNPVYCETQNFVSLVRSKCKTRLGNQLSSYAAIRYFQEQFGMNPILDPFQMNMIKSGKI